MNLPLMLCHNYVERKLKFPLFVQPKLNGIRARLYKGVFYSRDGKAWHPELTNHMLEKLKGFDFPDDLMLDGEFYQHGKSLQQIVEAISVVRQEPTSQTKDIDFCPFDYYHPDLNNRWFNNRLNVLVNNRVPNLVPTYPVHNQKMADKFYELFLQDGYEGAIYIMQDCEYVDGRSWYKLKRKAFKESEFKCVGITLGLGRHLMKDRIGSLICVTESGKQFNVGGGFTDKQREMFYNKQPIGKLITVKYQNLSNDGIPTGNTVFISVRDYE